MGRFLADSHSRGYDSCGYMDMAQKRWTEAKKEPAVEGRQESGDLLTQMGYFAIISHKK